MSKYFFSRIETILPATEMGLSLSVLYQKSNTVLNPFLGVTVWSGRKIKAGG
jgi:hypothetical protein